MRSVAALAVAVALLSACSGADGERAQQLLDRAQAAHARVASAEYELRMTFSTRGARFVLVLDGGAYLKGPRAGDQRLAMRTEGAPTLGTLDIRMELRGRTMTTTMNGRSTTTTVPVPARRQYDWPGAMSELARYVDDVAVREDRVVDGERGATVAGTIDTAGVVEAAARLQALTRASGATTPTPETLGDRFGNTRAFLFVSGRTGLIRSAVMGFSMEGDNETVDVDVTYRLKSVDRPIPGL